MKDFEKFIQQFRTLSVVNRYGLFFTFRKQSMAEHTLHVMFLASLILEDLERELSVLTCRKLGLEWRGLALKAMLHDFPETFTGDIYGNLKARHPELEKLLRIVERKELQGFFESSPFARLESFCLEYDDETGKLVKFCDYLERVFFCEEELELGNEAFLEPLERTRTLVSKLFLENITLQRSPMLVDLMGVVRPDPYRAEVEDETPADGREGE